VGESGHSSLLASFKVPSSLQASPSGLYDPFRMFYLSHLSPKTCPIYFCLRLLHNWLSTACISQFCSPFGWIEFEYALPSPFEWADTSEHSVGQLVSPHLFNVTLLSEYLIPFSFELEGTLHALLLNPAVLFGAFVSSVEQLAGELLACVCVLNFNTFFTMR